MPCDSGYLAANKYEIESKRCAEGIVHVLSSLSMPCPQWIVDASNNYYGEARRLNEMVIILCDVCTKMTEEQKNIIIYNGKNSKSRKLADWWDEHQKADKERIEKETFGRITLS